MRRVALTGALAAALLMIGSATASAQPVPLPAPLPEPPLLATVVPFVGHAAPDPDTQVAQVRRTTRRFHDLQRAENAGYGLLTDAAGVACIDMPDIGGMGVHFANTDLVGDPVERVRHPEVLVYRLDKRNRLHLAAVEYVVIASDWDATHVRPPHRFGQQFTLTEAGNRYGLPAFYSLHAWVWFHNPAGRFAMFNPRVTCPG